MIGRYARERAILQYVVVDGRALDQVASVYRVHRPTVKRWLEHDAGLSASDVESALD